MNLAEAGGGSNGGGQGQLLELDEDVEDDENHFVIDEDELDDVEPDVDPNTNEVDDVEPDEGHHQRPLPQVRFVRRADGKGFAKKVIDSRTMELLRAKKKKKKKHFFRGSNYRFDGTAIKKRIGKRPPPAADNKTPKGGGTSNGDGESVLSYLGIQRKEESGVEEGEVDPRTENFSDSVTITRTSGPKAKKSFKQPYEFPSSISISRYYTIKF